MTTETPPQLEAPVFDHECPHCRFLGRRDGHDLYVCSSPPAATVLVARYGNLVEESRSSPVVLPLIMEIALKLASDQGLLRFSPESLEFEPTEALTTPREDPQLTAIFGEPFRAYDSVEEIPPLDATEKYYEDRAAAAELVRIGRPPEIDEDIVEGEEGPIEEALRQ